MDIDQKIASARMTLSDLNFFLVYLLMMAMPFDIWAVFTLGRRGIKLFWIVGLALIAVFGINVCLGRQRVKITRTGKAILVFNIVALCSLVKLVNAPMPQWMDFLSEWLQLILYSLLFFVITSLDWTDKRVIALLKIWIGVAAILSLYGVYQVFARSLDLPLGYLRFFNPSLDGGPFTRSGPPIGSFYRVSSVFIEPGYFAGYLLSPLLFVAVLCLFRKEQKGRFVANRTLLLSVLITLYIAYLFAFSMAAFAALAGVIVLALFSRELVKKLPLFILAAFLILVAVSFALKPVIKDNFLIAVFERTKAHVLSLPEPDKPSQPSSPYAKTSLANRVQRARSGLEVWKKSPIIGVGLNNFSYYFPEDVKGLIHSGAVQILAELGLLGLIAFGLVFGSALLSIKRSRARWSNFPESVGMTAFYYIIWVRVFHFLIAENWIRNTIWMDLTMAVLILYWLRSKASEDSPILNSSDRTEASKNPNLSSEL